MQGARPSSLYFPARQGSLVGIRVGAGDGNRVGPGEGDLLGARDGKGDGTAVVGCGEGVGVGRGEGTDVGWDVGPGEGEGVKATQLAAFEDFEQVLPLLLIIHANLVLEDIENPLFELLLSIRRQPRSSWVRFDMATASSTSRG